MLNISSTIQSRPVGLPTPQHEVLWWRSRRRQECQNARMPSNPMDLSKSSGFASISSMDPRVFTKVKCKQLANNRKKWTIFHSQFENWAIVHIYGGHTWWPKNHMKPINSGSELLPRPEWNLDHNHDQCNSYEIWRRTSRVKTYTSAFHLQPPSTTTTVHLQPPSTT